jgi:hypothetical protein
VRLNTTVRPLTESDMNAEPTVADMMAAYAQDAVDHARRNFRVELDFSVESVQTVESLLRQMYDAIPRGARRLFRRGPSDDTLASLAKMYGGYVGEVMRRRRGGEWVFDMEVMPGRPVICLRKGDDRLFPPAKVHKRLTNGPEDDVWFYFQAVEGMGTKLES